MAEDPSRIRRQLLDIHEEARRNLDPILEERGPLIRGFLGTRAREARTQYRDPSPRVVFRRAAVFDGWGLSGEAARMRGSVPTVAVDAGRWSAGGERRRLQGWNGDSGAYDLQILALAA
jgi:hypothetical protein